MLRSQEYIIKTALTVFYGIDIIRVGKQFTIYDLHDRKFIFDSKVNVFESNLIIGNLNGLQGRIAANGAYDNDIKLHSCEVVSLLDPVVKLD